MTTNFGQQVYTQGSGTTSTTLFDAVRLPRNPNSGDNTYPLGKFWVNTATNQVWYLATQSSSGAVLQANWANLSGGSILAGIDTINTIAPDGSGNFTLSSSDGSISITPIANGLNLTTSSSPTIYQGNSGGNVTPNPIGQILTINGNNSTGINVIGNSPLFTLTVSAMQATTTQQGTVTLATNAQAIAGTDAANAVTSAALAAKLGSQTLHGLPIGAGTAAALTWTAAPTNGQLLIGSTGVDPVLANITSSDGSITVTNGAGSINLTDPLGSGRFPVTPYVVGPVGKAGYQTIQSAITAANAAGGGIVVVQPGTYTENLTLQSNCHVMGLDFADAGGGVTIVGVHTPPASGGFVFNNVALQSATHIFSSAVAGTAHLIIANAAITVTNGYTFNLANWTGKLEVFDVNDRGSTNDGFVNNTGGSEVAFFESAVGAGTGNTMTISGVASIFNCAIGCPINCVTGCNFFFELNVHLNPLTFSNNSTGEITLCEIDSGITMSSSGAVLIATSIINTATNPAIAGAGAGALSISDVTFLNNSTVAGTLTVTNSGLTDLGSIRSNFTNHGILLGQGTRGTLTALGAATNGQLPIGSTGVDPVLANITSTGGTITVTNGPGTINIDLAGGHGAIEQFIPDSGTNPVVPNASAQVTMAGSGSTTTVGSLNTLTFELTGLTTHNVLVGAGTATITKVPPSATSGVPLISQGAAADPTFGTAVVAGGGTGITSATAYAVLCGGTTSTNPFQSIAGVGTSGQILTSNGAGALPTFQSGASSSITLTGDTGGGLTGNSFTFNAQSNCGATAFFAGASTTLSLKITDGSGNTLLGNGTGNGTYSGSNNTALGGATVLQLLTSGSNNLALGGQTLEKLTTGSGNNAIGLTALAQITTGSNTIAIGINAGANYTSSESNNIILGNNQGTLGESNVIRIGLQGSGSGQQNTCFVAGITGAVPTSGNTPQVVLCDNTGNLAVISSSTSGFVLTSNGSATPSFQASAAPTMTITTVAHAASPYTVLTTDQFLAVNVSGGVVTIKLPNAPTTGRIIYVKDSTGAAATSNISVTTVGGTVTIDGQTTYTMATNYQSLSVVFDGSNYEVF